MFCKSHSMPVPSGAAILNAAGVTKARTARARVEALVDTKSCVVKCAFMDLRRDPFLGQDPAKNTTPRIYGIKKKGVFDYLCKKASLKNKTFNEFTLILVLRSILD